MKRMLRKYFCPLYIITNFLTISHDSYTLITFFMFFVLKSLCLVIVCNEPSSAFAVYKHFTNTYYRWFRFRSHRPTLCLFAHSYIPNLIRLSLYVDNNNLTCSYISIPGHFMYRPRLTWKLYGVYRFNYSVTREGCRLIMIRAEDQDVYREGPLPPIGH